MDRRELLRKSASRLALVVLSSATPFGKVKLPGGKRPEDDAYDSYLEAAIAHEDRDLPKACELYAQALKRCPNESSGLRADIVENLGKVRGSYLDAQKVLDSQRAAVEQQPEHPKPRFELGDNLMQLGRSEEAIQEFQTFLTLQPERDSDSKPNIVQTYLGLARCYSRQGNYHEARRWIEKLHPEGGLTLEAILLACVFNSESEALEYRMLIYSKLGLAREAKAAAQFFIRYYGRVGWRYTRALKEVGIDADAMYIQHALQDKAEFPA